MHRSGKRTITFVVEIVAADSMPEFFLMEALFYRHTAVSDCDDTPVSWSLVVMPDDGVPLEFPP